MRWIGCFSLTILAFIFAMLALSRDWNSFGDIVIGIVTIGVSALFLFLAYEVWDVYR